MICTLSAFQVNVLAGLFCCLCCLCTKMTSAEAQLAGFHDLHNSSYTLMALSPLATHRPKASKANSFVGGPTGYINASCCLKFTKWFHLNDQRIAPSSLWYDPDYWRFTHSLMTCARHQSDWNDSKIHTPAEWKNSYSYEQCSWAVSGKTLRDKNHKKYLTACWATSFICLTKFSAGPLLSPLLISTSSRIRRLWISNYTRCSGKIWHTLPKMSVAHAVGTTFELM